MVSAHSKTLTIARLRSLARLYRQGVTGVDQELLTLTIDVPERLAEMVGVDVDRIVDLTGSDSAAELVVAAIEKAPRRARQQRTHRQRQRAEELAHELADQASVRDNGFVDLDYNLLQGLVGCGGYRYLGLTVRGHVRVLERARLKAAFKECKNTRLRRLYLTPDVLWLHYETKVGRGRLCFRAERLQRHHEDVLIVPELAAPRRPRSPSTATVAHLHTQPSPSLEAATAPVPSPPRATSPFVHHFLDVLSEGLL